MGNTKQPVTINIIKNLHSFSLWERAGVRVNKSNMQIMHIGKSELYVHSMHKFGISEFMQNQTCCDSMGHAEKEIKRLSQKRGNNE